MLNGNYSKAYNFIKGKYEVIWRYSRENSTNSNNSVEIFSFYIEGSDKGRAINCVQCPNVNSLFKKGSIRNKLISIKQHNCLPCPNGFTSNLDSKNIYLNKRKWVCVLPW